MIGNFMCSTPKHPTVRNRYTVFEKRTRNGEIPDQPKSMLFRTVFAVFAALFIGILCCQLPYDVLLRALKSVIFGIVAVLFSWDVVYFDSSTPGIVPPSPLSPSRERGSSKCAAIDTNYMFSIFNGVVFTIMAYLLL